MKKPQLKNEKLNEIGRKLLDSAKLPGEELEKIVSSPQLFSSLKAKIKVEESRQKTRAGLGQRTNFPVWGWQKMGLALGVLVVILAGVIVFILIKPSSALLIDGQVVVKDIQLAPVNIDKTVLGQNTGGLPGKRGSQPPERKIPALIQPAGFKSEKARLTKSLTETVLAKRQTPSDMDSGGKFYLLTSAIIPGELKEDVRIIRAEMTRSSLFALGVNIAPNDEQGTIKTDLLVGVDGVPRAIRFVKSN